MFLHGFPEAAFVWDELLEHFAQPANGGYRCIAPNLRGYEQSSQPADVAAYRPKHLVQDIAALPDRGAPLACLVAHDWGGAVAWNFANQLPQLTSKLAIINSPHPGTFLRALQTSPSSSAGQRLHELPGPARRGAAAARGRLPPPAGLLHALGTAPWLTEAVKAQYRAVWDRSLTGGLNYYRASPLRPPRRATSAPPPSRCRARCSPVDVPTLVLWGMQDTALLPELLDGLDDYIPG